MGTAVSSGRIGILGTGYAVPPTVRTNDDPIFDWLKEHTPAGTDLFKGYDTRHVLAPGEKVEDLMTAAAQQALDAAGLAPARVDLLLGCASVSDYITPNALACVHRDLGLPARAAVVPLNNDYSNFNVSLVMASALIRTRGARVALVVCGSNWTQHVDYHTPQSVSAGDGAAAAVIGRDAPASAFRVVDWETETQSQSYGVMYMQGDPIKEDGGDGGEAESSEAFTNPYFHITDAGMSEFKVFGGSVPPAVVQRLLARHRLQGKDVTLVSHQTSAVLIDLWQSAIQPAQYLQTLSTFANVTHANVPLNLAYFQSQITQDHAVLLSLGTELHANAVLLERG